MNDSRLCRGLFIEFAKPRKGSGKSYGQRLSDAGRARMPERGAGWALLGAHAEHAARMRFQRPWGIRCFTRLPQARRSPGLQSPRASKCIIPCWASAFWVTGLRAVFCRRRLPPQALHLTQGALHRGAMRHAHHLFAAPPRHPAGRWAGYHPA